MESEPVRFILDEGIGSAPGPRMLVDGGVYDIRRLAVGPGGSHGPGRHHGDAVVYISRGLVTFEVNRQIFPLEAGDVLWVPAGAQRGFVAGPAGALLLAIHLPRGEMAHDRDVVVDNTAAVAQVTTHHGEMVARLRLLTAGVAQAERNSLVAALRVLVAYWHTEVLPHALGEEGTIYARARDLRGAEALLHSLMLDHHALGELVANLDAVLGQATDRPETGEGLRIQAAMVAAQAQALFAVHARKENECLLPLFAAGGRDLGSILQEMEKAFAAAKEAAERGVSDTALVRE